MRRALLCLLLAIAPLSAIPACSSDPSETNVGGVGGHTLTTAASSGGQGGAASVTSSAHVTTAVGTAGGGLPDDGGMHFCELPGSIRFEKSGVVVVPGAPDTQPNLDYLVVPTNFCVHYFGKVGNARQLRFASNGDLFVASPTTGTTGGGGGGQAAIVVLPDTNKDGYAEPPITYLSGLPSTQGLMFANGYFYYQDHTKILRTQYKSGDHAPSGAIETVADIQIYVDGLHWPKTLDQADDGTIFVGNGGFQSDACDASHPFHGGILKLDGTPGGTPVVKGCRNPIAVRCQHGHDHCFATELALDYSNENTGTNTGSGREKLIPIREGDDWGFPCCASKGLPYSNAMPEPDCSMVTVDTDSFLIGDTPFGLDFEPGNWPEPWRNSAIVAMHGAAGSWYHAKVVAIAVDPATGDLLEATTISGTSMGGVSDFAVGWDDMTQTHGRPAAITFAEDGRMFLSNDANGDIVWIAPLNL